MDIETQLQIDDLAKRIDKLEARTSGSVKLDHQPTFEYPEIKMFKEPEEIEVAVLEKLQTFFFERLEYKTGWGRNELKTVFNDCLRAVREEKK